MKLELSHVSKKFGEHIALTDVSLKIECQTLGILGPSGGGKSTFLKLIAGLEYPDQGEIYLDGSPIVFEEGALRKHRGSIGTVFQSWNLFPHLTALENISLPLHRVHRLSPQEAAERGMELLARFRLQDHAQKKPAQLSGGQSQRVAIVRAIAGKPCMLLFDEPTSALDPIMTGEVLDLIFELKEEGRNIILASHHISFVKRIADWIVFLADSELKESASCKDFFERPRSQAAKEFVQKVLKY